MNTLISSNRQAIDESNIPLKSKNKFVNFLFFNQQLQEVTFYKTTICFFAIFIVCMALSIFFFVEVSTVQEVDNTYYVPDSTTCMINTTCNVTINIQESMQPPVYFMYSLGNFYQNVRNYIQSKSNHQLAGNSINRPQAQTCFPYITNKDMGKTTSWSGVQLDASAIASPCGAIAQTYFNDTFKLYDSAGMQISINQTDISWKGDQGQNYKRHSNTINEQWIDPENQHFIVWMRTSGLPNFRKPWGRIEQNLPVGNYTVSITNRYDPLDWHGSRSFVLGTSSMAGGKSFMLPIAFMLLAVLSCLAGIFFCWRFRALRDLGRIST